MNITPKSLRIDTGAPLDNQVINKKNRANQPVIIIHKSYKNYIKSYKKQPKLK